MLFGNNKILSFNRKDNSSKMVNQDYIVRPLLKQQQKQRQQQDQQQQQTKVK